MGWSRFRCGFLPFLVLAVLLAFSLVATSCGSASTSVIEPTDTRCAVALSLNPVSFGAQGGKGTAAIAVGRECQWSASTTGSWLTLSNPITGQGPGTLTLDAAPNRSLAVRSADLVVAGQKATVSQEAATCNVSVTSSGSTVGPAATEVRLAIATDEFCSWKATSRASWIVLRPVSEGNGPMEIVAVVAANNGEQRGGSIEIGSALIQITQRAAQPACEVAIAPASGLTASSGGTLTVAVTAGPACTWTVVSEDSWIAATPARGTGAGSVRITTAPNSGAARSGSVLIGDKTFSAGQAAAPLPPAPVPPAPVPPAPVPPAPVPPPPPPPPCTFSLDALSASVGAAAGSHSVQVTTLPTCTWSAQSPVSWVAVAAGNRTGSGSVALTYQANTGSARSAVITIAGIAFTLSQQSGCTYTIAPTTQTVGATGATMMVNVKTAAGCAWDVQGEPSWISAAPDAGQGPGSTVLTVQANTSLARSSTFTIAGQSFTLNQAIGLICTYSLNPQSLDVSSNSQTRTITVTTQANCPVSASESANWLSIPSVGQAPNAVVTLVFEEHNGNNDRTTTVAITGLNFTRDVQVRQRED